MPKVVLLVHCGAGNLSREMDDTSEAGYKAQLNEGLNAGYAVLKKGGSSIDAVETAIRILEDSPLFNAGRGAVFTHDGKNELDAAIMNGKTHMTGAVATLTNVKNPITLARAVMEKSDHVFMAGPSAEKFAKKLGLEIVDPKYFWTESRWKQLQQAIELEKQNIGFASTASCEVKLGPVDNKFGTVGAVALDQFGNLASGTSTGGITNKQSGRIGDSPIIGAGTYADNATCAVSCTGHGEFFIRQVASYDVAALMKYRGLPLSEAASEVMEKKLTKIGGHGGMITLDAQGNFAMVFNTEGMFRGYITTEGQPHSFVFENDLASKVHQQK